MLFIQNSGFILIVVEEKVDNDHSKYKLRYGINGVHNVDWLFEVTFIANQILFICLKLFIIIHKKYMIKL